MTAQKQILIYVQHLLGIGHLRRAQALAKAMNAHGMFVTLVTGGMEIPDLHIGGGRLVQLPPLRAQDNSFKELVDENDQILTTALKQQRRDLLLNLLVEVKPDAVITELFPLGRRKMKFELDPLLEAAQAMTPAPLILSSVRDILVHSTKKSKADEAIKRCEKYDHILVHSDENIIRLEQSYPDVKRISEKLIYTGFVADRPQGLGTTDASGEIMVSAGGGSQGAILYDCLLEMLTQFAASKAFLKDHKWRILIGWLLPDEVFEAFVARGKMIPLDVIVERARPDFSARLYSCDLSISQCGYNTTMEVLRAKTKSLVVPFNDGGETEQDLRASMFSKAGRIEWVKTETITPQHLLTGIEKALSTQNPNDFSVGMNGDIESAEIVSELIDQARAE
jgi:predicted glycosyltransferase